MDFHPEDTKLVRFARMTVAVTGSILIVCGMTLFGAWIVMSIIGPVAP